MRLSNAAVDAQPKASPGVTRFASSLRHGQQDAALVLSAMSYVILGRAIKNEYLALGTIFSAVGIGMLASGGKKEAPPPSGKSTLEKVKETVKFNASSSEEEEFIKKYVEEAEKEAKH